MPPAIYILFLQIEQFKVGVSTCERSTHTLHYTVHIAATLPSFFPLSLSHLVTTVQLLAHCHSHTHSVTWTYIYSVLYQVGLVVASVWPTCAACFVEHTCHD